MIHPIEPPRRITAYGCKYAAIYAACMGAMFTAIFFICVYFTTGNKPFGIQLAAVISYTILAAWQTFGYQRYGIAYNPFDPAVKRVLPRITLTFAQFACILWLFVTLILHNYTRLQTIPHFDDATYIAAILLGALQVWICRRILSKAVAAEESSS